MGRKQGGWDGIPAKTSVVSGGARVARVESRAAEVARRPSRLVGLGTETRRVDGSSQSRSRIGKVT